MKKKLLFVIPSLEIGGAEKSLINLLHEIDERRFEVHLFLMVKRGVLIDQLPQHILILPESQAYKNFSLPLFKSVLSLLRRGKIRLVVMKILFTLCSRRYTNVVVAEQRCWKYLKHFFPVLPNQYDAAIGYLEKNSNYIVADRCRSEMKIGWIHTDLEQLRLDFNFEKKHFDKLDYIVTVSKGLAGRLQRVIPDYATKIKTIENINSRKTIHELAQQKIGVSFDRSFVNIIFVGRLEKVKGIDLALNATHILLQKGYNVRFYLIGDGAEKENLQELVHHLAISNAVFFLGVQSNPYPYIKQADIYVLTSHYEGKSIALEEAKILNKPIVITDFSSSLDQIEDEVTGLIAQKNADSVAVKIERLINDKWLVQSLSNQLEMQSDVTESEIDKLYQLIEN